MFAFFSVIKSISQISKQQHGTHKLFHRYFVHPQWLPDRTVSTFFFRYFSLFSFTSLWKTLCKVKHLWGADLTPWTVSMKEGSPISHVTCCTIQMQIGSCNINCLNQFCKSCKFGGPGKRAAPIYIYIYIIGCCQKLLFTVNTRSIHFHEGSPLFFFTTSTPLKFNSWLLRNVFFAGGWLVNLPPPLTYLPRNTRLISRPYLKGKING